MKGDILTDPHTLRSLANMHESLNWFADQVSAVSRALVAKKPARLSTMWQDVGPVVAAPDNNTVYSSHITDMIDDSQIEKLQELADGFRQISESCLILLRLELRCHCLMYLLPAVRKSNYNCTVDKIEPDLQVVVLCKDLTKINDLLSGNLDASKMDYLFHGLSDFMAEVLISNIVNIKVRPFLGVPTSQRCVLGAPATTPWLPFPAGAPPCTSACLLPWQDATWHIVLFYGEDRQCAAIRILTTSVTTVHDCYY